MGGGRLDILCGLVGDIGGLSRRGAVLGPTLRPITVSYHSIWPHENGLRSLPHSWRLPDWITPLFLYPIGDSK